MGRESRRARQQGPINNEGDKARLLEGGYYALERLQADLRMVQQYVAWSRARGVERLLCAPENSATLVRDGDYWQLPEPARQEALAAIWRPPTATEQGTIEETLEAMGLGSVWPFGVWAAHQFVTNLIPTFFHNAVSAPAQGVVLRVSYLGPDLEKRGYIPREKGSAKLKRDSEYWYRRKIKHPPDDMSALAREYLQSVNRHDSSRSRVEESIEAFESLLRRVNRPAEEG